MKEYVEIDLSDLSDWCIEMIETVAEKEDITFDKAFNKLIGIGAIKFRMALLQSLLDN